jgi:hypothetical protein
MSTNVAWTRRHRFRLEYGVVARSLLRRELAVATDYAIRR